MAEPSYFERFGHFINQFANVEAIVHAIFKSVTALPDEQARVICGGMKLSDVMETTKRLAKVKKISWLNELERMFSQLTDISLLRNRLVHRGVSISVDEIVSSNARTVRLKEDTEILRLKLRDIEAAALDLAQIFMWGLLVCRDGKINALDDERKRLVQEPWLYKSQKPDTPYRQLSKTTRSRKRQRPPSQA